MSSTASEARAKPWLQDKGPEQLELLFRALAYHISEPIMIADDRGRLVDASSGALRLLGLPRPDIIGRTIDDFAQSELKPQVSEFWRAFLESDRQEGTFPLSASDDSVVEVECAAKRDVLPHRHVVTLRDRTTVAHKSHGEPEKTLPWAQDYALYLLDPDGRVTTWYSGASRIYGFKASESVGQLVTFLYSRGIPFGQQVA